MPLVVLSRHLKTTRSKIVDLLKLSREARPSPILPSNQDESGWVFTEEMLQRLPWAKIFATGPGKLLENGRKLYCMICEVNVSVRSAGVYEIKRRCQSKYHLRQDRRYRDRYFTDAVRRKDAHVLYGERLAAEREVYVDYVMPGKDHKRPF